MINPDSNNKSYLANQKVELTYDPTQWVENYKGYAKTVLLFLTDKCNLRCPKCFNCSNMSSTGEMDYSFIKELVAANPSVEKYDIMGGEPLLHGNVFEILRFLGNQGKRVGLYTNGILLNRLPKDIPNLKINMAFHCIESTRNYDKPVSSFVDTIDEYMKEYSFKIVFLMLQHNKDTLAEFVNYIDERLPRLKKITIGQVRDEVDYYNDQAEQIVPLAEYAGRICDFVKSYKGRLNVEVFSEGILETPNMPLQQPHQLNRFRSVFPDSTYSDCLYDVALTRRKAFNVSEPLPFRPHSTCPVTGRKRCITDKIKLCRKLQP